MSIVGKAALTLFDAGITTIPIALDGSKRPIGMWGEWIEKPPPRSQVELMFKRPCGIAVLCGPTSGGLECIDFDQPGYFENFADLVNELVPGLLDKLTRIQTPRGNGGTHIYYRSDATQGNQKLAMLMIDGKKQTAIETRGKGGYAIIPPSPPEAHPSKNTYKHIGGPALATVSKITAEEREALLDAARSLNLVAEDTIEPAAKTETAVEGELRPGDDFNARGEWRPLLEKNGWRVIRQRGDVIHWQRPGKEGNGISATTGHCGDKLYVFSSNAPPFTSERTCSKFWAYTMLEHGGSFADASRQLRKDGYGSPPRKKKGAIKKLAEQFERVFSSPPPDDAPPLGDFDAPPEALDEQRITAVQLEERMHDDGTWCFQPGPFERVLAMKKDRAEWVAICDVLRKLKKKAAWDKAVKDYEREQRRQATSDGWRSGLSYRTNKDGEQTLERTLSNLSTILSHDESWDGVIAFNEMSHRIVTRKKPPFNRDTTKPWSDEDSLATRRWLERNYDIRPSTNDVHEAVMTTASDYRFNPLVEYINALESHDKEVLDTWLIDVFGAEDTPYVRAVGRRWMISAVARALKQGCKADCVLILEGDQGVKKSTALAGLCPDDSWFCDGLSDFGTKDQKEEIEGKWIIELGELKGFGKELELIKSFISRTCEKYRPSYGRFTVESPRTCVFAGTVNPDNVGYLRDVTGNRRFWPVKCHNVAPAITPAMRDQLWSEARDAYLSGIGKQRDESNKWWIDPDEVSLHVLAVEEQKARVELDVWHDDVVRIVRGEQSTSVGEILSRLGVAIEKRQQREAQRVGRILKFLGWDRYRDYSLPDRPWRYRRPEHQTVLPLAS